MRTHILHLVGGLAVAMSSALTVRAQSSTVTGTVRALGDSARRLRDVEIILEPGDRTARTDSLGVYRIVGVPVGTYRMQLRRLGYESALRTLDVVANRDEPLNVELRASAQPLATVTIAGRPVTYPARYAEAYTRAARGAGHYWTREQIDSLFPLDVESMLMRVPGVHVNNAIEFVRCRGVGQRIQVWVDGKRWTNYSTGGRFDVDAKTALRDVHPSSIQLMEIYSGPANIPGEFLDDACAVIVIWRK